VSLALASMLLVAVMDVLGILATRRRVLVEKDPQPVWHRPLEEQLRRDLGNARRFEFQPTHLRLLGYGGRNLDTRRETNRPAEVLYEFAKVGGETWLVRTETMLDSRSNKNRRRELVCRGLTKLDVKASNPHGGRPRQSGRVPECCRVSFSDQSSLEPIIEIKYCR